MEIVNKSTPACLLGSAIGDALGMPFENIQGDRVPELDTWKGEMLPGTHHKLTAGHWTDDTEMSIALAEALISKKGFNREVAASCYLRWFKGHPTGMGGTVRTAMQYLDRFDIRGWGDSGVKFDDPEAVGAGTVMRVAPLGVVYANHPDQLRRAVRTDAYITHAHPEAYAASLAVAALISGGRQFREKRAAFAHMQNQLEIVVPETITARVLKLYEKERAWGYSSEDVVANFAGRWGNAWQIAVSTIHCAFSCWGNFTDAVTSAVQLGGDTDTRAAVTGAIVGAVQGLEHILENARPEWLTLVNSKQELIDLDRQLNAVAKS